MSLPKSNETGISLYIPCVNQDAEYIKSVFNKIKQSFGAVECVEIIHTDGKEYESAAVVHFRYVVNNKLINSLKDGWAIRITHNKKMGSFWTAWHTTRKAKKPRTPQQHRDAVAEISNPPENRLLETEWPVLTK
jgi:hypothetical protein|tara:strand:- start:1113 stop:1514 length:402 start_codon:yes stop_codon:yes gene_type:complete